MSILGDFRKLFFGAKAVSKTAKSKVGEVAEDVVDSGLEKLDKTKDFLTEKIEDIAETTWDTSSELANKAKSKAADLYEDITSSDVIDKVSDKGGDLLDKTKEVLSDAGEKLGDITHSAVEKSDQAWEKIMDVSDKASEKIWDKGGDLVEKAKEAGKKIEEKLDETLEDFKKKDAEIEAKEREMDTNQDGYADKPIDFGKSALDGQDDFFEKAQRFADGESISDPNMIKVGDIEITKTEKTEKADEGTLPGFEDADMDGSELVDDAVIVTDDEGLDNLTLPDPESDENDPEG